ncbi:TPA: virulence protein [Klebsiella oxytoca]|nr:virulence protein [Klebsiella oxytoca]
MATNTHLDLQAPTLPQGGGVIAGMGESLGAPGAWGIPEYSIPLPVSPARYLQPQLSLTYSSTTGNGPFGLGWHCNIPFIGRSVRSGVPAYSESDEFLSLAGIRLVKCASDSPLADTAVITASTAVLLDPTQFIVTCYQEQVVSDFNRYEHWVEKADDAQLDFWVIRSTDGNIHLLGKNSTAQLADPATLQHIARWYLEETFSPLGETILYKYRKENNDGCDEAELRAHPLSTSAVYPLQILYGNSKSVNSLVSFSENQPLWMFRIDFNYGDSGNQWPIRKDCFSDYRYGFDVRIRRLCLQVVLSHQLALIAGEATSVESYQTVTSLNLAYDEASSVTTLVSIWQSASGSNGGEQHAPPLEFSYQRLDLSKKPTWQAFPDMGKYNLQQHYQLVDLLGDGLPGILYQQQNAWWYREPIRKEDKDNPDAVTWGEPQLLPVNPLLEQGGMLRDIDNDGRLEWLTVRPGLQGYYDFNNKNTWDSFIPLQALPTEFFHVHSWLTDISGDGRPDIALLGPDCIRLYPRNADGWGQMQKILQDNGVTLPAYANAHDEAVIFADISGSGQQHLVRINAQGVRYWPALGGGRFGKAITIPGFALGEQQFDPQRLLLADIDGSGSADILYLYSDHIDLYLNQNGNRYAEPLAISFPDGVRYDNSCQVQVADVQGLGVGSLVMTIPHVTPHHFICHLSTVKPWLAERINNNRGTDIQFTYRSSVQCWLDEKAQALAQGQQRYSLLPFPVHTLWHTTITDEITGSTLSNTAHYFGGVWDEKQQQFCGFRRVEMVDVETFSPSSTGIDAPAVTTVNWFLSGKAAADALSFDEFWKGDEQAWPSSPLCITAFNKKTQEDGDYEPVSEDEDYWLRNTLRGSLLRSEIYTADQMQTPQQIKQMRWQVRHIASSEAGIPAGLAIPLETIEYDYEGIAADPRCRQQLTRKVDEWGSAVETLSINYPRRSLLSVNDYPSELPEGIIEESLDPQQSRIIINRQYNSWYHLPERASWRTGLAKALRIDVFDAGASLLPANGFSVEYFRKNAGWQSGYSRALLTYQSFIYTGENGAPKAQGLLEKTLTSAFNEGTFAALSEQLTQNELESLLKQGGYQYISSELNDNNEKDMLWMAEEQYPTYASHEKFYRPLSVQSPLISGVTRLDWNESYLFPLSITRPDGGQIHTEYDYRHLQPTSINDVNDNIYTVEFDNFGRVTAARVKGTEEGEQIGYPTDSFTPPSTIDEALALTSGQPVAAFYLYFSDSWYKGIAPLYQRITGKSLPQSGGVLSLHQAAEQAGYSATDLQASLKDINRQPPHILQCQVEGYYSEAQRFRHTVMFSDGFSRLLQTAVLTEPGPAWQRQPDGSLGAIQQASGQRWLVSGKKEYDNKGNPVSQYYPYFVNDWKWVSDDSNRGVLHTDRHVYDAFGREIAVYTASGYLRRKHYYPWFVVNEDENDTAHELSESSVSPYSIKP